MNKQRQELVSRKCPKIVRDLSVLIDDTKALVDFVTSAAKVESALQDRIAALEKKNAALQKAVKDGVRRLAVIKCRLPDYCFKYEVLPGNDIRDAYVFEILPETIRGGKTSNAITRLKHGLSNLNTQKVRDLLAVGSIENLAIGTYGLGIESLRILVATMHHYKLKFDEQ